MDAVARTLIIAGAGVTLLGVLVWAGARLGLGRLPGDILVERGGLHIAFPIMTSIVLSIVLSVALNVAIRIWR
jgi:hypothetical protein